MRTPLLAAAAAAALTLVATPARAGEYVPGPGLTVHEWGTFTSFSGADGVPIAFSTEAAGDLPGFVYTAEEFAQVAKAVSLGKGHRSLQRMETPVIYFYAEEPRDVQVTVRFPQGLLTEFYPTVRELYPAPGDRAIGGGRLSWGKVRIIPPGSKGAARGLELPGLAPEDDPALAEHYMYARETDSALVRVCETGPAEVEKFLFYRGIGNFDLPLRVEARAGGAVVLRSVPVREITHALGRTFVLDVADDLSGARLAEVDGVFADEARTAILPSAFRPVDEVSDDLSERLASALVEAGLFDKEARAMVKTWRASYFEAPGTRVLYIVPRALTDQVLPLSIAPAPDRLERVLLGRAEVMTPEREASLEAHLRALARTGARKSDGARAAIVKTFGRYGEAAIERITRKTGDAEVARGARVVSLN